MRMKKQKKTQLFRIFLITALLLLLPLTCLQVSAADQSDLIDQQMQTSGADKLQNKVPDQAKGSLNSLHIDEPSTDSLANFTPANFFKSMIDTAKKSAETPIKSVVAVIGVLLLCALLSTMKSGSSSGTLGQVFDLVCGLCIAISVIIPVSQTISLCAQTINQSSEFTTSFMPVFGTLVVASGRPASALLYQGFMLTLSQVISSIASTTFVPMINIFLAFSIIGALAPGINIGGVAKFFKTIVTWGLTLCLTIFAGILTVQSLISQAADSVTMKTAKFVVGSAVPVIGSSISDALNTVVGCANLLKTATGAYAIVVFLLAFLPVILECLFWILAMELCIAGSEILNVSGMTNILKAVKDALQILFALVITCALALIVSISVMLLVGSGS